MKKSFLLYTEYADVIEVLTDEQAGQLFKSIFRYANGEEVHIEDPTVQIAFIPIKNHIDRDSNKWEEVRELRSMAGKKSGEVRRAKKQNEQVLTDVNFVEQKRTKRTVNVNVNVNDNVNVNVIKNKYGEYQNVLLTDAEYEKLKKEYPSDYLKRIENLSSYMKSTGKSYEDHLATIENWARKERKPVKQNTFNQFDNKQDYTEVFRRLGEI